MIAVETETSTNERFCRVQRSKHFGLQVICLKTVALGAVAPINGSCHFYMVFGAWRGVPNYAAETKVMLPVSFAELLKDLLTNRYQFGLLPKHHP